MTPFFDACQSVGWRHWAFRPRLASQSMELRKELAVKVSKLSLDLVVSFG